MNRPPSRFSLPLIISGSLALIFLILLVLMFQLLSAVQAENALLRQQIALAELHARSVQNQQEAELILRSHESRTTETDANSPATPAQ